MATNSGDLINTGESVTHSGSRSGSESGPLTEHPSFLGRTVRARMINSVLMLALLGVPVYAYFNGNEFWLDLATRMVILAIAAVSLNFILGFGGLISFGHAAFIGIGAYAVGIPAHHDEFSAIWHLFYALVAGGLFALITGAISLRTRGVHFIMITMAFAQMMFYAIVSIEEYGGDDGLVIYNRSEVPLSERFAWLDLSENLHLFVWCWISLVVVLYIVYRLVNSRFGLLLQGAKGNEQRMSAIGYGPYPYRLVAYVISGAMCAYAGALLGNFTGFISPEMMDWTRSGELMFMVILGGTGLIFGPVLGAVLFLVLEEVLESLMHLVLPEAWQHFAIHWHLPFGIALILSVLFLKGGVIRFLYGKGAGHE
ncbi:MAG: branched-chain amino acid ABC transporter permease [Burkholderiaceae bacterium]